MADYTEFVELANELLLEEGKLITLQQFGSNVPDPTKPWNGTSSADIIQEFKQVPAIFVPVIGKDLGIIVQDKELLKRVKQVAIVSAVAENLEDKITKIKDHDNSIWKIVWCQCLRPAEQTIFYLFGVER